MGRDITFQRLTATVPSTHVLVVRRIRLDYRDNSGYSDLEVYESLAAYTTKKPAVAQTSIKIHPTLTEEINGILRQIAFSKITPITNGVAAEASLCDAVNGYTIKIAGQEIDLRGAPISS